MSRYRDRDRIVPLAVGELVRAIYPAKEPEEVRAIRAFAWWEKAVPERVLQNARPVRVSRGVLTIHAATSVWANELQMLETQLIESLQKRAPEAGVRKLRVRVGPLPPLYRTERPARRAPPVVRVTELPEDLARALAAVGDDAVRKAVAEAAGVSLGMRRPRADGGPGGGRRHDG